MEGDLGGAVWRSAGKRRLVMIWASVAFVASLVLRYALSDFFKALLIYPDEFRYCQMAQSLADGRGFELYNLPSDFQKILYPIVLAPVCMIGGREVQQGLFALLNSAVISSAVFPVCMIAGRVLSDWRQVVLICLVSVIMPDMTYSMTFMSEVAYLPLSLWVLYGFFVLVCEGRSGSGSALLSAFLGVCVYVLYLCKEVALVFFLAYSVFAAFSVAAGFRAGKRPAEAIFCAEARNLLLSLASFSVLFVIFKLTLFRGMGNSYDQTGVSVLFEDGRAQLLFYGFFYYLMNVVVASGFFPVVLPAVHYSKLSREGRALFALLAVLAVVTAAVVSYTITVREDAARPFPRAHLRYAAFLWMPLLCVALSLSESKARFEWKGVVFPALLLLPVLLFYKGAPDVMSVDHTMLFFCRALDPSAVDYLKGAFFRISLVGLFLFYRFRRVFFVLFLSLFCVLQVYNNFCVLRSYYVWYEVLPENRSDMALLENLVRRNPRSNFLIMSPHRFDYFQRLCDSFLNYPNVMTVSVEDFGHGHAVDLRKTRLMSSLRHFPNVRKSLDVDSDVFCYKDLGHVDYVLLQKDFVYRIDSSMCSGVDSVKNALFDVYRLDNPLVVPPIDELSCLDPGRSVQYETSRGGAVKIRSMMSPENDESFVASRKECIVYGPGSGLRKGVYDFVLSCSCPGGLEKGRRLGFVYVCCGMGRKVLAGKYFSAGDETVVMRGVRVPEGTNDFEVRMIVDEPGGVVESVDVLRVK